MIALRQIPRFKTGSLLFRSSLTEFSLQKGGNRAAHDQLTKTSINLKRVLGRSLDGASRLPHRSRLELGIGKQDVRSKCNSTRWLAGSLGLVNNGQGQMQVPQKLRFGPHRPAHARAVQSCCHGK